MGTEGEPMTLVLRRLVLVAAPLTLAVVLWFHPPGGENVYAGVREDVGAWLFVHAAFLFFTPLLAIAAYLLLSGLQSRAAAVSRVALVFFLVFYTAYEVTSGPASSSTTPTDCRLPSRPPSPARSRTTTATPSSPTRRSRWSSGASDGWWRCWRPPSPSTAPEPAGP
jgi:hypothetical protein